MPVRGENVGTAYIRVLADGTGLGDSIKDEFDHVDLDKAGEKAAKDFDQGIVDQMKKDQPKTKREVQALFRLEGRKARELAKEMESVVWRGLEDSVRARSKQTEGLGERMIRDLRKGFLSGGGFEQYGKNFEKLFSQLPAMEKRALEEIARDQAKFNRDEESRVKQRDRLYAESVDDVIESYERLSRGQRTSGESMNQSIKRTIEHVKELAHTLDTMPDLGGDRRADYVKTFDEMDHGLRRINPRFRQFNGSLDILQPKIARSFGKGARNDFVNFVGSAIGGVSKLVFAIPKMGEKALGVVKTFNELRASGQTVFAALGNSFKSLGGSGGAFASSMTAAAVAIPLLVIVVGTLISALSLLLGVVVALASTISFALVGALAALAGTIAPIALGIGVLVAAIAGMSDAQKKMLKEGIKPMVEGFKEMGKSAADALFDAENNGKRFKDTIENVTNALTSSNMETLVKSIADEIGKIGLGWSEALDSPGFRKWLDVMSETIPGQMESLGNIVENTFAAIGNTLIAMQPIVTSFLNWLEGITDEWREFTGKQEGQDAMLRFFADAKESAKALGGFLKEVGGLLKDLLFNSEGKDAGDSMFGGMADAVARFRDYIKDGKLEKWFQDSKEFGEKLGHALEEVGRLLDALDSPEFRKFATYSIEFFGYLFTILDDIVQPVLDLVDAFKALFTLDIEGFEVALENMLGNLGLLLLDVASFGHADEIVNGFRTLGGDLIQGLWDGISQKGEEFLAWLGGIPGRMIKAFTGPLGIASPSTVFFQFGVDIITGLLSGIASLLTAPITMITGLASKMASAFGGLVSAAFDKVREKGAALRDYLSGRLAATIDSVRSKAGQLGDWLAGKLSSAFGTARKAGENLASGFGKVQDAIGWVIDKVQSLISWIKKIPSKINISMPSFPDLNPFNASGAIMTPLGRLKKRMASGGLANFAQNYIIGESGREAIVPLDRPLNQVDPAVRALSAFAQGKFGNSTSNSKTIDMSGWIITSPTKDPVALAHEVVNDIIAKLV